MRPLAAGPPKSWQVRHGAHLRRILSCAVRLALAGLVAFGAPRSALAHDLPPDRLMLWPDVERGALRAELTLDPEHTREEYAEIAQAEVERRVLEFTRAEFTIEVDGVKLELRPSVEELWDPRQSLPGDRVKLLGPLPTGGNELVVRVGRSVGVIVVSVPGAASEGQVNTLVQGSGSSPPYRLRGGPIGASWSTLSAEQLLTGSAVPAAQVPASARTAAAAGSGSSASRASPRGFHEGALSVLTRYGWYGVSHVLPWGIDHLLFAVALVLGSPHSPRRILVYLGSFTLAHTVTVAVSVLGLVRAPASIVEPAIALSIAWVGLENLMRHSQEHPWRPLVVFVFGLLHGLGFAEALRSVALGPSPTGSVPWWLGLVGFNLGVEVGQLVAVALAAGALLLLAKRDRWHRLALRLGSASVLGIGLCWGAQRIAAGFFDWLDWS